MAATAPGTPATAASEAESRCAIAPPLTVARATERRFPMAVYGCTGSLWNATSHIGCIDIVSREILVHGKWEISTPSQMAAGLPLALPERNGVFLDIGANLGYFSLLFATHGWSVVSVEPMRQNRAALSASLCLNPSLNVSLHARALTSPPKQRLRCVARSFPRNQGNGVLTCGANAQCPRPNADPSRRHPCEPVAVGTLDNLLDEIDISRVDVVKMDVEGSECDVLDGAQRLLGTLRPRLLQIEGLRENVVRCVHEHARRFGYTVLPERRGSDQNLVVYRVN